MLMHRMKEMEEFGQGFLDESRFGSRPHTMEPDFTIIKEKKPILIIPQDVDNYISHPLPTQFNKRLHITQSKSVYRTQAPIKSAQTKRPSRAKTPLNPAAKLHASSPTLAPKQALLRRDFKHSDFLRLKTAKTHPNRFAPACHLRTPIPGS